jgi:tetratricopeptide (TPR) repeat protein
MRLAMLAVLVAGWTALDARAEPSAPSTVDHYQVGKRLFERKRYAEAVEAFRLALSVAPRPEVLYSLAQAQRLLGDCASAVDSYRAFLAGRPEEPLAEYARANIDRCEQAESARRTAAPPWYHDAAGDALVVGGAAAGVAGIVIWRSGRNAASGVADAPDYQAFLERQASASSAVTYQRLGLAAMVMGATAVIGGIVHYAYRVRAPSTDAGVGITVIDGGALIAGHARF